MVRSCALLFSWKKIIFFWSYFFPYYKCFNFKKNDEKRCDARFFGAKMTLRKKMGFQKKVKKIGKNAFFWKKSLWSQPRFYEKSYYQLSCENMKKRVEKKTQKKRVFVFWNSFLKMKIGHLFLSIFEFKKKVLKIFKLSVFSISLKYSVKWIVSVCIYSFIWKNYKKILEKREMSFYSSENKNWTFRGSFDKFSAFFPIFFILFLYVFLKKRVFSMHLSCDGYKKTSSRCISELRKKNE